MEKQDHRFAGITIDHPRSGPDREKFSESQVRMMVARPSGKTLISVPLTEDELVRVLADASRMLAVLRKVRVSI